MLTLKSIAPTIHLRNGATVEGWTWTLDGHGLGGLTSHWDFKRNQSNMDDVYCSDNLQSQTVYVPDVR